MSTPKLPAFETLLKSRDVEDPVNLWLHRPLAYGFVALVYRTSITPNQVTLLSTLVGVAAGACFLVGTQALLVWGGVLLWTSAILDGADGILARAKQSFSPLGRAIDGTADLVVAFATVLPAFYHMWVTEHDPLFVALAPTVIVTAIFHIYLYDFYKESYLQMTNPQWNGRPDRVTDAEALKTRVKVERLGWVALASAQANVDLVRGQRRVVERTDPWASRDHLTFQVSDESVQVYRLYNRGPMKLWAMISLAPHSYLMAICAMFDRFDLYFWFRLVVCNLLFVLVMLWQRGASRRTRAELERLGLSPVPAND
jgi:phosphatidylglycerophosphate synthase